MPREKLAPLLGKRLWFTATFSRYGSKAGFQGRSVKTALFVDVSLRGDVVTDHIWVNVYKRMGAVEFQPGDEVGFTASVGKYEKGYKGRREDFDLPPVEIDYHLTYPVKVKKTGRRFKLGLHAKETVLHVPDGVPVEVEETPVQDLDLEQIEQGELF